MIRINYFVLVYHVLAHVVAQLVEALRYRLDGHGFSAQWNHWNILLT